MLRDEITLVLSKSADASHVPLLYFRGVAYEPGQELPVGLAAADLLLSFTRRYLRPLGLRVLTEYVQPSDSQGKP